MTTRTQKRILEQDHPFLEDRENNLDLESLSDEDLETLLFDEPEKKSDGFWNLPTVAGLSLILVGVAYLFQEMGIWNGFDLGLLVNMLPLFAGILIILIGFGVLSWRPSRKQKKVKVKKVVDRATSKNKTVLETKVKEQARERKKLMKSRDKKIAGVCGGIAEYFNIDPTLVRIAFVIGTIATQGSFLLAYFILAVVMPKPDSATHEERITIVRDA